MVELRTTTHLVFAYTCEFRSRLRRTQLNSTPYTVVTTGLQRDDIEVGEEQV